jgi:SH3-like domain-containing protein
MKNVIVGILVLACLASAARLAIVSSDVRAYSQEKRRVYEKPLFLLGKGEVVELVRVTQSLSQVRTQSGRIGWVETAKLDTVRRPPMLSLSEHSEAPMPVDSISSSGDAGTAVLEQAK